MGRTTRTASLSRGSTTGAEVFHWGEEALFQAADLPQRSFPPPWAPIPGPESGNNPVTEGARP